MEGREVKIHNKEGYLFCVQTDHLSGEGCGCAIEALYEARCVSAVRHKLMSWGIRISADACDRILQEMEEKQLNEWIIK